MRSEKTPKRVTFAVAVVASAALLVGCSGGGDAGVAGANAAKPAPTATSSAPQSASSVPTLPGFDEGTFPEVPLMEIPDLSLLDSASSAISTQMNSALSELPGLKVSNAQCDASGQMIGSTSSTALYGDGSGSFAGPDGGIVNYGDGSGSMTIGGVEVINYGDGSGSYDNGTVSIHNYGDGSGSYNDGEKEIWVYGDGSGSIVGDDFDQRNYGDGSGALTDGDLEINNYGDGSGNYRDGDIEIENYGDGTGAVNGEAITIAPIPPIRPIGKFPPITALQPINVCGTVITLSDSVLFDFDKSELRPEAKGVMDSLAAALIEAGVPAGEVLGHTDSVGEDDYNLTLSEQRAAAVVAALVERGVSTTLTGVGKGESSPVAPNEVNGQDDPAGRQLNRRVEIVIPAF